VSITINSVASLFRTIEVSTTDYIIGSIPVPNYPETEDAHAYIHKDGWMLAYYLKVDPVGKIVDWQSYDGVTIKRIGSVRTDYAEKKSEANKKRNQSID
jgi:hypothetical protein